MISQLDCFTHDGHGLPDWCCGNETLRVEGETPTLIGRNAEEFIESLEPMPNHPHVASNAPNTPFQPPREYLDRHA